MKFVDDPEAANWLAQFGSGPDGFEWDDGNRTKNRQHEVEQSDIEALFQHPLVFVGRIVEPVMMKTGGWCSDKTLVGVVLRLCLRVVAGDYDR